MVRPACESSPVLVPGVMRESGDGSPAGPEGGAEPRPEVQPASPPRPPRRTCLPGWPRTPPASASRSRCVADGGCIPDATPPARIAPRPADRSRSRYRRTGRTRDVPGGLRPTTAVGYSEHSTTDLRGSKNSIGSWHVTPQPATLALLAVGGLGMLLRQRR